MTELEGASHDIPNKSGETPMMNALASMVQSVVQEMKVMNRRMDQLSEPVNLEDEDLDYEEGELERGDADRESIVSLDTKVSELTKAREAGNNKSKSTSALHDIAQDLDLSEKTGSAVDEELANIVNSLLRDKIPDEKTQAKVDQYPKPANIEGLRTPRVNPLIWSQLPAQVRTQDSKHQKLTKKVRPASHSSSRGRKSTFTNHYSANRNRRFAPYAYSRARYNDNNNFSSKSRSPPMKGKKEGITK